MNQKKAQDRISKKQTSKKSSSKQDEDTTKKKEILKVSIFSTKEESIKFKFLHAVGASGLFSSSTKYSIGFEFAISLYSASKDYTIQYWLMNNAPRFEALIPSCLLGSWAAIYFYRISDAIKKKQLALIKSSVNSEMHLLFVGYDAVLPELPEEIDQNIPLIQNYFPGCHSMYIAVDEKRPDDALVNVLDELISFDA
ncbi:MAG: hypothetical protein ACTSYI_08145 [Promethearchaeota archaeon]